jgi:recombinational DNA repair protein RecR
MALDEIRAFFIQDHTTLTGEAIRQLRKTLLSHRQEIESKIKTYENGIHQIDRVLTILHDCPNCGKPTDAGVCDACLKEHGGDSTPLIHPLLSPEQGEKE